MNLPPRPQYNPLLLTLSALGFICINVPFLYFTLAKPEVYDAAMRNGVALVFIAEAFLLMGFAAWVIARLGLRRPGWLAFIVLTLLGSLAFSLPLFLYLHNRER